MEQKQMLKDNSNIEQVFKISSFCIRHCRTINKSSLSQGETECLENCGYNRGFINNYYQEILAQTLENAMAGLAPPSSS